MTNLALKALLEQPVGESRGRPPRKALQMGFLRELGAEDVQALQQAGNVTRLAPIQRLRTAITRWPLGGRRLSPMEISAITGTLRPESRQLEEYPDFQELVAYYREQVQAKYLNVHERLASLGISTIDELEKRLEETPRKFKTLDLIEQDEGGSRPLGHSAGPSSRTSQRRWRSQHSNQLRQARMMAKGARVINVEPE